MIYYGMFNLIAGDVDFEEKKRTQWSLVWVDLVVWQLLVSRHIHMCTFSPQRERLGM